MSERHDDRTAREHWIQYILGRIRAGRDLSQAQIEELERLLENRVEHFELSGPAPEPAEEPPSLEGYRVEFELRLVVPEIPKHVAPRAYASAATIVQQHLRAYHPESRAIRKALRLEEVRHG